jgi:hypothetical protein
VGNIIRKVWRKGIRRKGSNYKRYLVEDGSGE